MKRKKRKRLSRTRKHAREHLSCSNESGKRSPPVVQHTRRKKCCNLLFLLLSLNFSRLLLSTRVIPLHNQFTRTATPPSTLPNSSCTPAHPSILPPASSLPPTSPAFSAMATPQGAARSAQASHTLPTLALRLKTGEGSIREGRDGQEVGRWGFDRSERFSRQASCREGGRWWRQRHRRGAHPPPPRSIRFLTLLSLDRLSRL